MRQSNYCCHNSPHSGNVNDPHDPLPSQEIEDAPCSNMWLPVQEKDAVVSVV